MKRTILHCDCNGFYASVECALNPTLAQVPMAVCGDPQNRKGIILAKNELAKRYQIKTAETVFQALKKCPALTLVSPHHEVYAHYSREVNRIYRSYTDLVEPFGIDESWLDITHSMHLFGSDPVKIADEIRRRVKRHLGITISVGISFTKTLAKLGSDYQKPDATTLLSPERFEQILYPLPVDALLSVGRSTAQTLRRLGIHTIGDLARSDVRMLRHHLGKLGQQLYQSARGEDEDPVRSAYQKANPKSVSSSLTFSHDLTGKEELRLAIMHLADVTAGRLRAGGFKGSVVHLTLKNDKLLSATRQRVLGEPTDLGLEIARACIALCDAHPNARTPVRMAAVGVSALQSADDAVSQLSLFASREKERTAVIEKTVDQIRQKYGVNAIYPAALVGNGLGISL